MKKFKRRHFLISILITQWLLLAPLFSGLLYASTEERPFLYADIQPTINYPPYSWISACDGQRRGVTRDLLPLVFNKASISYRKVPYDLNANLGETLREHIRDGKIDGALLSDDFNFQAVHRLGTPLMKRRAVIVYQGNISPPLTELSQLASLRGAITTRGGTSGFDRSFRATYEALQPDNITTIHEGLEQLLSGDYDYIITNGFIARSALWTNLLTKQLVISKIPTPVYKPLYLVVAADSSYVDKLPAIQSAIANLRASGREAVIYEKNMSLWVKEDKCRTSGK